MLRKIKDAFVDAAVPLVLVVACLCVIIPVVWTTLRVILKAAGAAS